MRLIAHVCTALLLSGVMAAHAEEIGCVTTEWKLIGANHRVCVEAFSDPRVAGVTCHVSQARTGGLAGTFGVAQDPSQFSIACRQTGPIQMPATLPTSETVFSRTCKTGASQTAQGRSLKLRHRNLSRIEILDAES